MSDDPLGAKGTFMRLRWPRYLPRFPAVLLMPVALAAWMLQGLPGLFGAWELGYGWPFEVTGPFHVGSWLSRRDMIWQVNCWSGLAMAYLLAMAVDRLVFPLLRRRRGQERATPPEPS